MKCFVMICSNATERECLAKGLFFEAEYQARHICRIEPGDRNGIAHHIYWLTAAELGYGGVAAYVLLLVVVWGSALRLASQLSELVLDGNLHDLEALHAWLAKPDCPLRILVLRNLPKGDDQHMLIKGLQANVSLQELSLQSPQGLNAKGITPALAKLILEHPGLRKLTVQLCNVKSFDKAVVPVLNALRSNRRLRWVTLHFHKNQRLDFAEEVDLRKQLAQIVEDNRNLFRFDYSIAGQVTSLGNWRY